MHKAIDKWQVQRTEMAFVCLLLATVLEARGCGVVPVEEGEPNL